MDGWMNGWMNGWIDGWVEDAPYGKQLLRIPNLGVHGYLSWLTVGLVILVQVMISWAVGLSPA